MIKTLQEKEIGLQEKELERIQDREERFLSKMEELTAWQACIYM